MCVLLERRLDDAGYGMAEGGVLREQPEYAMFDLLQHVRNTVRSADLHQPRLFIDRRLVPIDMEGLAREGKFGDHPRLRLGADVIVAGVVPPADIEARNVFH